ncbi:MAG: acetoin utilization protein AcuC, partial [Gammaproteobacteria bacterium]|nr:acetoin utilization protein AcuC [Gammaproteobacteria bacterium]
MASAASPGVCVYYGEALGRYGFGEGHPFGPDRLDAFWREFRAQGLEPQVRVRAPVRAAREALERFHTPAYVSQVQRQSESGLGYLDYGDTPAFVGVYEAAATVAGSTLDAVERVLAGECRRAFVPIAGLHHARRDQAAGFCVFNDCGIVIETLLEVKGMARVAYVDIDAHHGDGVFYGFEDDPRLVFADVHEDGQFLYPGTGAATETGRGPARGTKLNLPLPPAAGDRAFLAGWERIEAHLRAYPPDFVLLQCGADSIAGDPLTHLQLSVDAHAHAARRLCAIADEHCQGRLVAMGGGGYNR